MDHSEIATRLIKYVFDSGMDGIEMKVNPVDEAGFISFVIKFSSITDKDLSEALKSCAENIVSAIPWWDRDTIGMAIVSRNLSKFIPEFTNIVKDKFELMASGDHSKFGFGANNKSMLFKPHVTLLYNLFINAAIFPVKK